MNIKVMGFAFILVSMALGCAGTVDTDRQKSVQGVETVQGTETAQGANSDSYDPDEVTCKRIAKVGTRFKTKVCATNREWKASEESAGRTTEEIQRKSKLGGQ